LENLETTCKSSDKSATFTDSRVACVAKEQGNAKILCYFQEQCSQQLLIKKKKKLPNVAIFYSIN
jgi:hypothetical protein